MNRSQTSMTKKINRMTGLAILSAIVVVLQIICTFIKFGPFSITLALAPIIIGAAIYGSSAGAFLGFMMGAVVLVTGLLGWDGGTVMYLMGQNAVVTVLLCLVKSTVAGYISGILYRLLTKKNEFAGVLVAGMVCPIVNTGLFVLGMLVFFLPSLRAWANGQALIYYIFIGLAGWNFVIEFFTNLILSGGITRVIAAVRASKKHQPL